MPSKLLNELQSQFRTAERENKVPEEEHERDQPDFMETNENSNETIGTCLPPWLRKTLMMS